MTNIKQKALALVNEVLAENGMNNTPHSRLPTAVSSLVLLRAIEQHEAFRQEVSDAVKNLPAHIQQNFRLSRFIIAKPDPLVEALEEWINSRDLDDAASFRAAIEKRGGKIVWGEG